jgi:acetate kinase
LEPIWKAVIMATDPGSTSQELSLTIEGAGQKKEQRALPADLSSRKCVEYLLNLLREDKSLDLVAKEGIDAVGHRVVHGGIEYDKAVIVDDQVEAAIQRLAAFAPLHNLINLEGIQVAREILGPAIPQIAVFDTSFHRTLSEAAATYPGPYAWLQKAIRRYGFHGTSFRWASGQASRLLKRENDPELRLIICHLGGGCSLAATIGGKSVDTTMGFTPLDGIAMCTRSGALDPGILLFLMRENPDIEALEKTLERDSGLQGLSGLPGDTRILLPEASKGNPRAKLAMDVFIHRLQAGMGQMMASLNGRPDAIVFTDAIGEDEPLVRSRACEPFKFIGIEVDPEKNATSPMDTDISFPKSPVRVLIVKSREDWQIVRECHQLCQSKAGR